ncbi:MAG: IS4 family transposase [Oscillospiraceae bacterium]
MRYVAATKAALADAIRETAEQHSDGKQFSRQRKLTLDTMLRLLIGAEGGSLAKVLREAGVEATPAALSQRRSQIDPSVFREVFTRFNAACTDNETFHGYRVLAVDGTVVNMPRNPDAPSFIQNDSAPAGYNQMFLVPLLDLRNYCYVDAEVTPAPQKDEIGSLITMLNRNDFDRKTLIIADRGYESYNLIAHLLKKPNTDFLIRVKQNRSAMREVARLPMLELDCQISFSICTTQKNSDKQNKNYVFLQVPKKSKPESKTRRGRWDHDNYFPMRFRICRFQLDAGNYETIATSLPQSFTLEDIKALYHMRWGIETSFRDLKYTVGLVHLHGKSDQFVEQEIYAALTAFNFASRIVREVVIQQPKDGVYAYRVNFKNAVALVKEHIRNPELDNDTLVREIAKHTIPIRPGRQDRRNLKVKGFVGFTYRIAA